MAVFQQSLDLFDMMLSHKEGVKARKKYRCCLCGEVINIGDTHDTRSGVNDGDMWKMRMHPECHAHEQRPGIVDAAWYEEVSDPAFARADAVAAMNNASDTKCATEAGSWPE